jgi:hypothetical protein
MEYVIITSKKVMDSLNTLAHLAEKNRYAITTVNIPTVPLNVGDNLPETEQFYAMLYSSNGVNASLVGCAEQVYMQAVNGDWFPVKRSEYANIAKQIGGLYDSVALHGTDIGHPEVQHRFIGLNRRVADHFELAI